MLDVRDNQFLSLTDCSLLYLINLDCSFEMVQQLCKQAKSILIHNIVWQQANLETEEKNPCSLGATNNLVFHLTTMLL